MDNIDADFVLVGSGPSSFAAFSAIPSKYRVTIVDIGNLPSTETLNFVSKIRDQIENGEDSLKMLNSVMDKIFQGKSHIGDFKKYFGDKYSYDFGQTGISYKIDARASVGSGGFSSVWGSTVLPFSNFDLSRMSLNLRSQFRNGYLEISDLIRIEGHKSNDGPYESYSIVPKSFEESKLSNILDLDNSLNAFIKKCFNTYIFPSSVMVGDSLTETVPKCIECGLCHIGCPYGFIWNSFDAFNNKYINKFKLIKGKVVHFVESDGHVTITLEQEGKNKIIKAKRLILASGPISTAKLVIDSLPSIDSVLISDSQTFFKHGISLRRTGNLKVRNTLAELMVSVNSKNTTQLFSQLYSRSYYSDFRASKELTFLKIIPAFIKNNLLSRLVTFLVYLPEERSGMIKIQKESKGQILEIIERSNIRNFELTPWIKFWLSMLLKGIFILPLIGTKLTTGGGNHIGKSRLNISNFGSPITNKNGQLYKHQLVYVVDGSSLPAVPAGPITFSIMANARQVMKKIISTF
jgi:hypothetical protein